MRTRSSGRPLVARTSAGIDPWLMKQGMLISEHTLPKLTVILCSSVSSTITRDTSVSPVVKERMLPPLLACGRGAGSGRGSGGCQGLPLQARHSCRPPEHAERSGPRRLRQDQRRSARRCPLAPQPSGTRPSPLVPASWPVAPLPRWLGAHLLEMKRVPRVVGQAWVVDAPHERVALQPARNVQRILRLSLHAEPHGLDAAQQQPAVKRAQRVALSILRRQGWGDGRVSVAAWVLGRIPACRRRLPCLLSSSAPHCPGKPPERPPLAPPAAVN